MRLDLSSILCYAMFAMIGGLAVYCCLVFGARRVIQEMSGHAMECTIMQDKWVDLSPGDRRADTILYDTEVISGVLFTKPESIQKMKDRFRSHRVCASCVIIPEMRK